ncbi:hypothetical protein CDAR_210711 [Caerostris darwini]|uniref:Uncharacterized protein n=1 Tax=Caerostris darwini TaxID=1538125 RepID=A0AAV4VRF4_9ARAC|nr:hypothetical protein CDAR_210711 [Caerostris darwini]
MAYKCSAIKGNVKAVYIQDLRLQFKEDEITQHGAEHKLGHSRDVQQQTMLLNKVRKICAELPTMCSYVINVDVRVMFYYTEGEDHVPLICNETLHRVDDYLKRFKVTKALQTAKANEVDKLIAEEVILKHGAIEMIRDRGHYFMKYRERH